MIPVRRTYNQNWIPEMFNDFLENNWVAQSNTTAPAINVSEDENAYQVEVAAPGMTKEDFKIYLSDEDHLVVTVEKKQESETAKENQKKYLRREFSYTKFQQSLALPDDVDREQISASVNNGILTIDLHKKVEQPKTNEPRVIDIL